MNPEFDFRPPPRVSQEDEDDARHRDQKFRMIVNSNWTAAEEMRLMRISALMV